MVLFIVLAVAVIVALFAWAPWDDDNAGTGEGNNPGIDVNIDDNTRVAARNRSPAESVRQEENRMIALLLLALLLILLFGGLGIVVTPFFFILLVIVLIAALAGGFYGRGRYW